MSAILRLLYQELQKGNAAFYRDPRTSWLPLLGSPWPMVAILTVYLVTIKKLGPKFMENRRPFNVKLPMQIYNVTQVLLNLYIFISSLRYSYLQPHFKISCQAYDPTDRRETHMLMLYPGYLYYITKYLDLFDTVFFLLRKNYRQITFLHLYHHTIMVYAVWVYLTLIFASHYTATGVLNSFIHFCMYCYYFVAALKPKFDLLPYKRLLTQIQILQFCYLTIHFAMPLFNNWCGLDLFWTWIAFLQNLFMLILFSDFYYKTYVLKARYAAKQTASAASAAVKLNGNGNVYAHVNGNGNANGKLANGKETHKVH